MTSEERRIHVMGEANQSRTVVSVPCSPARSKGIHSPLQRGGVGGGAVYALFSSKKRYAKKEQGCVTCSPLGRCTSRSVIV